MICKAADCARTKIKAKGLCGMHYQRFLTDGDFDRPSKSAQKARKAEELGLSYIREYLSYCSETGEFRWVKTHQNRVAVGSLAGNINNCGYRRIIFMGRNYPAHHLAWWFVHGVLPSGQVDHRNGIRNDDRIENLRLATANENARNRRPARNSTSQYLGVCRYHGTRWHAQIKTSGRVLHLGYFGDEAEAAKAYDEAAHRFHGSFANLNFPREAAA